MVDCRSRLRVSSACGRSKSQGKAETLGARDWVRCAMGMCTGKSDGGTSGSRVGTIATLGDGLVGTLGEGGSSKVMRRGVAWKFVNFAGVVRC